MATNRDIAEQVYYDLKGIIITSKGIDARGDFYPFSNILKYELRIISPDRKVPLGLLAVGVFMLVVGIGIVFLIAGIWVWYKQKPAYWLVFETHEIKNDVVYQTNYQEEGEAIKAALDLAISKLTPD